jgi:microcompartment protein CcmK/EutM
MQLARVDGTVISTIHHRSLNGFRAVVCQPIDENGRDEGSPVVAVDSLGAAIHQRVVYSTDGSAARNLVKDPHSPLRIFIVALVDPARG